jgi:hypothetical protein
VPAEGPRSPFPQHSLNTRPPPGISTLIFLSSVAGSEEAVERIAGLALEQLKVLAQATVFGGSGWPQRLRTGAAVTEATNELVHTLKVIVHDLFETRRSDVRWVSETAQLDQEEAAGGELLQWSPATARLGFEPPAS